MRFGSILNFVFGIILGFAVSFLAVPIWQKIVMSLGQQRFSELTFSCDNAMRTHFLATQQLSNDPTTETVATLQSAEIGLIECQDYDIFRKTLIRWGLSENELSEMALLAVEARASDLREVVRFHEIRY